jgi:hypothetical protein
MKINERVRVCPVDEEPNPRPPQNPPTTPPKTEQ